MTSSENAMQAINDAVTTKANSVGTGVTAGGLAYSAAKPETFGGSPLAEIAFGQFAWLDIFQILAAMWITIQILKVLVPLTINIVRYTMPGKPKKPTSTQSTSTVKVKKPKSTKAPA